MLSRRAELGMPTPPGIPENTTYPTFRICNLQLKSGVKID
jgi:hypothetical protein